MLGRTRRVLWSSVVLQSMKMNVFHVFVLVLVMWAAHSHGRAYETESITYNNTQLPYKENLYTGPVIHRNLKHFDYFYLALQWPKSYCNSVRDPCWQPLPDRFTLHGLWPQQNNVRRIDCRGSGNTATLDIGKLHRNRRLVQCLRSFWPNLLYKKSDELFWTTEYAKHGNCFFSRQEDYFTSIVRMMTRISHATTPKLYGVHPGTHYSSKYLQNKIFTATGFSPKLQCSENTSNLYQILFCAEKSGDLFNCDADQFTPLSNCRDGWVVLPPLYRRRHGL